MGLIPSTHSTIFLSELIHIFLICFLNGSRTEHGYGNQRSIYKIWRTLKRIFIESKVHTPKQSIIVFYRILFMKISLICFPDFVNSIPLIYSNFCFLFSIKNVFCFFFFAVMLKKYQYFGLFSTLLLKNS